MDPRDLQIQQAQNNPNILTPLSGAPPPTQLQQRAEAQPNAGAAYQQAGQLSKEMADKLYGSGTLQGLAGNIDSMTKSLFQYDQQLEKGYSPYPNLPFYTENPADLYRGAAGFAGRAASGIGQTQSAVGSVENSYQNAINSVVDRFLDFYRMAEDRRQQEEVSRSQKEAQNNDFMRWIIEKTGGKVTNPVTGEEVNVPGPRPTQRDTSVIEVDGRKKLIDTQTGQVIQDLGESTTSNNLFNKGTNTQGTMAKKNYPPPMSPVREGIIQDYGGMKWISTADRKWRPYTAPQITFGDINSKVAGTSASMKGQWQ